MNETKIKKAFDHCFKEMFLRVGEEHTEEFTKQNEWYTKKTWTTTESNDFRDWMKDYLKKTLRWSKKRIDFEVGFFMLDYSWKIDDNPPIIKMLKQ